MITWDTLIADTADQSEIDETERAAAVEAFRHLKLVFGEPFFPLTHPICAFWINRAPWVRRWTVWLSGVIRRFASEPWFPKLINDLRNPVTCGERLAVLDVAARLAASGFSIQLDPTILIGTSPKKPDLFATLGREPGLYIEIADLRASHKERGADRTFREIADLVTSYFPDLMATWHVSRSLAPAHLAEVVEKARATMEKAKSEATLETLHIEGTFIMAVAPANLKDSLTTWARKNGLEAQSGRGPAVDPGVLDRLSYKLKIEQEQLPTTHSNVVVINTAVYSRKPGAQSFFQELSHAFEEEVFRYPHVAFVILVCRWLGDVSEEEYRFRGHTCLNRQEFDMVCSSSIILRNRFAHPSLTSRNEEALLNSLRDPIRF
jgi:hypothetical protein